MRIPQHVSLGRALGSSVGTPVKAARRLGADHGMGSSLLALPVQGARLRRAAARLARLSQLAMATRLADRARLPWLLSSGILPVAAFGSEAVPRSAARLRRLTHAAAAALGILLALGRRSELPIIRSASIAFIELWRGVPLVTVLFMASVMLPLCGS